jgi:putative acetyltransferase
MDKLEIIIRKENENDYFKITEVVDLAFNQKNEGSLIQKLRNNPGFIQGLSLVAEIDNEIVGHILFTSIKIIGEIVEYQSLALAPLSVHPKFQKTGIGKKLTIEGIKACVENGFTSIIVIGYPEYYPKFGFEPAKNGV